MPTVKATLILEVNGQPILGSPIIRRLEVDETSLFMHEDAPGAGFSALPTSELSVLNMLFLGADRTVTLRVDGQSDKGIILNAGGFALLFDVNVSSGPTTNATVENQSGATANLKGVAGGT